MIRIKVLLWRTLLSNAKKKESLININFRINSLQEGIYDGELSSNLIQKELEDELLQFKKLEE